MEGLIIWAYNKCRSTMALYCAIRRQAPFPVKIVLSDGNSGAVPMLRLATGFREDEFDEVPVETCGNNYEKSVQLMDQCPGYAHLFCAYQLIPTQGLLIREAVRRGEKVFAAGEAPCNMYSGWRWLAKEIYMRYVLRYKLRGVVSVAEKFICFSGEPSRLTRCAGWPDEKVIPFGYFPPPLEGSKVVQRKWISDDFHILATGILSSYRGADVLVGALKILKQRGIKYRATITQDGPLLPRLKSTATKFGLPIEFPGRVAMSELINLYETCSVYVGAGRREPWGMRLNDALNCGAPLVVSTGMGGRKLVDDYGCGAVFKRGDPVDLADKLQEMAADVELYLKYAVRAVAAAKEIEPEAQASKLLSRIHSFAGWV